jgi:hypothetical protein
MLKKPIHCLCSDYLWMICIMPYRFLLTVCLALWPNLSFASCSDLSLVLAIDSSGSVAPDEFELQLLGYAEAFSNPQVHQALSGAGIVDVAAVFWADADFTFETIPWHRIQTVEDAKSFAMKFLAIRREGFGDTNIGAGVQSALNLLDLPHRCTRRAVIDVSGDGESSVVQSRVRRSKMPSVTLTMARAEAARFGVTVNALAITNEETALAEYYRDNLITGSDSFVMSVAGFDTFGVAIVQKLKREIGGPTIVKLRATPRRINAEKTLEFVGWPLGRGTWLY